MKQTIGITGGIASGKSSISSYIRDILGYTVIDADVASREAVVPGEEAYQKIIAAFGEQLLLPNKEINRAELGAVIFHDKEKRLLLNSIVHPAVRKRLLDQKERAFKEGEQTVFMDIPLLFESGLTHMVDKTLLIFVDKEVQLERLMARNKLSKEDAEARIASQMPLAQKKQLADAWADNNGSLEQTKYQVHDILKKWNVIE